MNAPSTTVGKTIHYPSRVDWWLAAVLVGAPVTIIATGIFTLRISMLAGVASIIAGIALGAGITALTIPCVYTLTERSLIIRAGLLKEGLPLDRIRKAEKSSSAWSAPALSLRRVKITLDDGWRLISPGDRDRFIADLNARLLR